MTVILDIAFDCDTPYYRLLCIAPQASSSIQLSAAGRLLYITHIVASELKDPIWHSLAPRRRYVLWVYDPLLPRQPRQLRQIDLSVTFHTAVSKPVTS